MSQTFDSETEKPENLDFSEVELAVRRWAAQTGHENDQEWFRKMKEQYE
jgi:hypothetical protein